MREFVRKGISEWFRLAKEGERVRCPECGAVYVMRDGTWKQEQ